MIENPAYGGAYAYGKTCVVPGYQGGSIRTCIRRRARRDWLALIPDSHDGYLSWERAEAIRNMVSDNSPAGAHHGAPKPSSSRAIPTGWAEPPSSPWNWTIG